MFACWSFEQNGLKLHQKRLGDGLFRTIQGRLQRMSPSVIHSLTPVDLTFRIIQLRNCQRNCGLTAERFFSNPFTVRVVVTVGHWAYTLRLRSGLGVSPVHSG